ncbi:hypothetical protein V8C42DRAFT_343757 [Trichoderma barbatum]
MADELIGYSNSPFQAVASAATNKVSQTAGFPYPLEMLLVLRFKQNPNEEKTHARCNTLLRVSHAEAMDYRGHLLAGCYFGSLATGHSRGRLSSYDIDGRNGRFSGLVKSAAYEARAIQGWEASSLGGMFRVEYSERSFSALWGPSIEEFQQQFKLHERVPDMIGTFNEKGDNGVYVTAEELGITAEDTGELSDVYKALKDNWD